MKQAQTAVFMSLSLIIGSFAIAQDATQLEEQYKTCSKHYIPADKCTLEIYRQLKNKDDSPLDSKTALALKGVKEYRRKLKSPRSMEVHSAYVTENGDACLEVGGQNGLGGQTVDRIIFTSEEKSIDGTGFLSSSMRADGVHDFWNGRCIHGFHRKLVPGTDVTEKVNKALKDGK